jgi:hypothetical protein
MILGVVSGILVQTLLSVTASEAFHENRTQTLDTMRLTINRMTRELRQATEVDAASTSARLVFKGYVGPFASGTTPTTTTVVYVASGTTLTRQVGSGTPVVVQRDLASTSIFTYVDAPPVPGAQWVKLLLQVKPRRAPDTTLVLDSEVNLRNRIVS